MPSVTNPRPKSGALALSHTLACIRPSLRISARPARRLIKSGAVTTTATTRIKAERSMMPPKRKEERAGSTEERRGGGGGL